METRRDKLFVGGLFLLLVLAIVALVWGAIAHQRQMQALEARMQTTLRERQTQQEASVKELRQRLDAQAVQMLSTMSVPLGWAVRKEWMDKNPAQIRAYFDDLIFYPGVRSVELVDSSGTVLISSDKGRENQPVGDIYPAGVLQAERTAVFQRSGDQFVVGVPVLGLSAREATVVLVYDRTAGTAPARSPPNAPANGGA